MSWTAVFAGWVLVAGCGPQTSLDAEHQWGQWRGPLATGFAPHADPPLRWSETENVRWKTELPGIGHSTPVVWGDHLFLTLAIPYGEPVEPRPDTAPGAHDNLLVSQHHRFEVLSVDRESGAIRWREAVEERLPSEGGHVTGSLASNSPITDGERVYAFFGSRGLYCLDLEGELLWEKDLGRMQTKHAHGEGASPVLHGETLVVNWDHDGASFVTALDRRTGEPRWRMDRDERTSWATPIVVEEGGRAQLVVSGTKAVRGYDLDTGEQLWECGGLSDNVVASPVFGDGIVFAGSSYEKQAMLAIRIAGARGDLTRSEHVLWTRRRRTPYVPSPLLVADSVYVLHHYQGILSQLVCETGREVHPPIRLPGIGNVYASPVSAAGRVYVTDQDGATLVLSHAAEPGALARNQLDDRFNASAALVGDELFLRGERFLYCLREE